eukprot:8079-Eustigmatos_ZCMA.PRE.1
MRPRHWERLFKVLNQAWYVNSHKTLMPSQGVATLLLLTGWSPFHGVGMTTVRRRSMNNES